MNNTWARKYSECKKCGETSSPHKALGFCKKCYEASKGYIWQKKYREDNLVLIRKNQREKAKIAYKLGIWKRYPKNKKILNKLALRDGRRCRKCGTETGLTIEHKIPRCVGGKNNLENLEILCKSCNVKAYHQLIKEALKLYFKDKM